MFASVSRTDGFHWWPILRIVWLVDPWSLKISTEYIIKAWLSAEPSLRSLFWKLNKISLPHSRGKINWVRGVFCHFTFTPRISEELAGFPVQSLPTAYVPMLSPIHKIPRRPRRHRIKYSCPEKDVIISFKLITYSLDSKSFSFLQSLPMAFIRNIHMIRS